MNYKNFKVAGKKAFFHSKQKTSKLWEKKRLSKYGFHNNIILYQILPRRILGKITKIYGFCLHVTKLLMFKVSGGASKGPKKPHFATTH